MAIQKDIPFLLILNLNTESRFLLFVYNLSLNIANLSFLNKNFKIMKYTTNKRRNTKYEKNRVSIHGIFGGITKVI